MHTRPLCGSRDVASLAVFRSTSENQRRFESTKTAEKKALKAIEQIANGNIEDWVINAIKANMCRDFDLMMESNERKGETCVRGIRQ